MIPFNKPHLTGKEAHYIYQAVESGHISGNGIFTKKCQAYFEQHFGFKQALLTTSCTDALEMCAILADIKPGDEVIIPSYTFVSTPLAFVRQGAKIVFADSGSKNPNMDVNKIEELITSKTKAIVPVHYAGVACDMDIIMALAAKYGLLVIEDAAQAIDSYYLSREIQNENNIFGSNPNISRDKPCEIKKENDDNSFTKSDISRGKGKPLGSIGDLAAFSFHETKNIISGEGGLLAVNNKRFIKRAEIIWEKGTNRAEFFRGEVNKYGWVDIGSSFLPSEIVAAFLWAQIENIDAIQVKRKHIWEHYYAGLKDWSKKSGITLPDIPSYATGNGHLFYIVCNNLEQRNALIQHLKAHGIEAVFHYLSLHRSPYYHDKHDGRYLPNADRYTDCLVRLPLFYELDIKEIDYIIKKIIEV